LHERSPPETTSSLGHARKLHFGWSEVAGDHGIFGKDSMGNIDCAIGLDAHPIRLNRCSSRGFCGSRLSPADAGNLRHRGAKQMASAKAVPFLVGRGSGPLTPLLVQSKVSEHWNLQCRQPPRRRARTACAMRSHGPRVAADASSISRSGSMLRAVTSFNARKLSQIESAI
jgi:hypothetical protein